MKSILALYDISGIQKYIFSTNQLKDIIGASELVRSIFENQTKEHNDNVLKKYGKEIYCGGGNAVFEFDDEKKLKDFNKEFSTQVLDKTPGLKFYCATVKKGSNIKDTFDELFKLMASKKNTTKDNCSYFSLPVMAQSTDNKYQVSFIESKNNKAKKQPEINFLSNATFIKNNEKIKIKNSYAKSNDDINNLKKLMDEYKDMDSISKLDSKDTENMMAVVHIDGNNMGKIFKIIYEELEDYKGIKLASEVIDNIFKKSIDFIEYLSANKLNTDEKIPFRKIYQNGDDITFICQSAYAFVIVEKIFEEITKLRDVEVQKGNDFCKYISATAGIVFVKPHFPFYDAYNEAERRCKDAKKTAKDLIDEINIDFWLDYCIIRGSNYIDPRIKLNIAGEKTKIPYYVLGVKKDKIFKSLNFKIVTAILKSLSNKEDSIKKSKLKQLRNAFLLGNFDFVISEIKSQGKTLEGYYSFEDGICEADKADFELNMRGNLKDESNTYKTNVLLFDVLNIMDIYKDVSL